MILYVENVKILVTTVQNVMVIEKLIIIVYALIINMMMMFLNFVLNVMLHVKFVIKMNALNVEIIG